MATLAVASLIALILVIAFTVAPMSTILLYSPFRLLLFRRLWGVRSLRLGSIVEIMIFPEITMQFTSKSEDEIKLLYLTFPKD